jgi:segregation and condensation protein A
VEVSGPSDAPLTEAEGPHLALDGFAGPLSQLLALARAHRIDLACLSITALLEQLGSALQQAPPAMPLGQKADWVVTAAWLVHLRSLLLQPADTSSQQEAMAKADGLRQQLVVLEDAQVLAGWLERQPQLGQDVFARGRAEVFGVSTETSQALDVIEFLWAGMAQFEDPAADTAAVYRPVRFNLYTVADARDRIMGVLAQTPAGVPLERLLPSPDSSLIRTPRSALLTRSGWASTFMAGLELTKESAVEMEQGGSFQQILIVAARGPKSSAPEKQPSR